MLENYDGEEPVNIGNPTEYSISSVAETIAARLDFQGEIIWDTSQPSGQYKKTVSFDKLKEIGYDGEWISLDRGLLRTCNWFTQVYPRIRGYEDSRID